MNEAELAAQAVVALFTVWVLVSVAIMALMSLQLWIGTSGWR